MVAWACAWPGVDAGEAVSVCAAEEAPPTDELIQLARVAGADVEGVVALARHRPVVEWS
jgi:hypothetical protein